MRSKLLFTVVFLFLGFCKSEFEAKQRFSKLETLYAYIGKYMVQLEIADTETKRGTGLMHRTSLGKEEGMLFVFPKTDYQSFWMKNTLIPLSIGYFTDDYKLVEVFEMEPNQIDTTYNSSKMVRFAVEMNSGWYAEKKIEPGTSLVLEKNITGK